MAEKDFRVRKGLVVDGTSSATSVAVTTGNVVVADGTLGLTNGILLSTVSGSPNVSQISSQPTNGNIKIAPNGTGDIVFDTDNLDVSADSMKISIKDNVSPALDITEGSNSYLKFVTTNSSEQIVFGKNSDFGTTTVDLSDATISPASLNVLKALTVAADQIPYFDSNTSAARTSLTAFARTDLLAAADATAVKTSLGLQNVSGTNTGDVSLAGSPVDYLTISGQTITMSKINLADTDHVTGTLANGNVAQDLTISGGSINNTVIGNSVAAAGTFTTLSLTSSTIKDGSTTAITLSSSDVIVEGDLTVTGNDLTFGNGATVVNTDANTLTITEAQTNFSGDIQVGGNDIKSNGGTTAITLSGADVTIAGDLYVSGDVNQTTTNILDVVDHTITLASGSTDSSGANGANITFGGSGHSIKYLHSGTKILASTALDVTGTITGDTSLTLDSTTITTAEISVLDGISLDAGDTPDGAVTADKVLAVDANKDLNDSTNHLRDVRMRNLTSTGTITSTQLSSDYGDIKTVQVASGVINAGASTTVATIDSTAHRAAEVLTMVYNTTENTTDLFKTVIMWDGHDTTLNDAGAAVHYTNYAVLSSGDVASGDIAVSKDSANILVKFVAESGIGNDTYVIRAQLILLDI